MAWRAAPAVRAVLNQANARWPNRNKGSDGVIGDEAHSSRASDHNPDSDHVVLACDLTHDPAGGVDCKAIFNAIVSARDKRVKYIIHNRRLCSTIESPWVVRQYGGSNPHTGHMHVSVRKAYQDDASPWPGIDGATAPPVVVTPPKPSPTTLFPPWYGKVVRNTFLARRLYDVRVWRWQSKMRLRGWNIVVDGRYGPASAAAATKFQREKHLSVDGILGKQTYDAAWTVPVT